LAIQKQFEAGNGMWDMWLRQTCNESLTKTNIGTNREKLHQMQDCTNKEGNKQQVMNNSSHT